MSHSNSKITLPSLSTALDSLASDAPTVLPLVVCDGKRPGYLALTGQPPHTAQDMEGAGALMYLPASEEIAAARALMQFSREAHANVHGDGEAISAEDDADDESTELDTIGRDSESATENGERQDDAFGAVEETPVDCTGAIHGESTAGSEGPGDSSQRQSVEEDDSRPPANESAQARRTRELDEIFAKAGFPKPWNLGSELSKRKVDGASRSSKRRRRG